jgi:hypothetical protein
MGYATVKKKGNSGRRITPKAFRKASLWRALRGSVKAFNGSSGKGEGDSSWNRLVSLHMCSMGVVSSP